MDAGPSFASRRPAATGLPAFSLPPPDIPSTKYPASASYPTASSLSTFSSGSDRPVLSPLSSLASAQPFPVALPKQTLSATVSSVLTPPSGVANDGLSPLSSGANTGSSMGSQPGTTAGPAAVNYSYMSGPSWPTPQVPSGGSYSYTGPGNHNQVQSPLLTQGFPNARSMYQQVSPSVPQFPQSSGRHIGDGLPPPTSYHQASPVFLTPISGLGGGGGGGANSGPHQMSHTQGSSQNQTTPTTSGPPEGSFRAQQQQHQQQQQYHQQQQHQQHQQQNQQRQQQQQRTPLPGHDISHQPQPQPGMQYPPYRTTPQQQSFPTFPSTNSQQAQPSPTTRSPPTPSTDLVLRRGIRHPMDSGAHPGPGPLGVMSGFGGGRGGGMSFGYQMPGPGGPIMTNMHQPGTPMVPVGNMGSMMPGGYNSGGPLHVYGQGHPQQIHQDRPFKCDQCQQSFNRNHDLKRHKRIHMAVKPFPCTFCEKAFSRKDALKRHRLVKGCGERMKGEEAKRAEDSPPDRSDIMSDTTEDSPRVAKRETM